MDNGSHDGTPDAIRTEFPHVHLMATGENLGFAAGNNRGLQAARGRVIVFLNPDTEPAEGSLARLVEALDADRTLGIVGPRLTYPDGALQPSVRGFPTFGVALLVLLKLYRVSRRLPAVARYDQRDFDYNRAQDVEQLMGACLAMPRAVVDAMKGFDERFWMWFEEVDLCLRVRQAGWRVRYCPDAIVMHRLNQSTVLLHSAFLQRMYARSLVAFFEKHHPRWQTRVLRSVSGLVWPRPAWFRQAGASAMEPANSTDSTLMGRECPRHSTDGRHGHDRQLQHAGQARRLSAVHPRDVPRPGARDHRRGQRLDGWFD